MSCSLFDRNYLLTFRPELTDFADSSFELVVAATSAHWMDLDVVLPKVHRVLAPGGQLLVWRNVFGDPTVATTPFRAEVQRIVRRRPTARSGNFEDAGLTAEMLTRAGLFSVEEICAYRWNIRLDANQIHSLFSTFSDWTPGEVEDASAAARALGGQVIEHYSSWLILASPVLR